MSAAQSDLAYTRQWQRWGWEAELLIARELWWTDSPIGPFPRHYTWLRLGVSTGLDADSPRIYSLVVWRLKVVLCRAD